jgi:hypothetical protein
MTPRFPLVMFVCLLLVGCSAASSQSAVPTEPVATAISCTLHYTGHGLDTLDYAYACSMHTPSDATSVTVTSVGHPQGFPLTWCSQEPINQTGLTSCFGNFVVIAGQNVSSLTVTATFQPRQEEVQTTVSLPPATS